MADTVRYLLEEMVPELEALEERGYFSRTEIRSIVQRRQDFEYALKRMAAVKGDYLRYIEYEEKVEELRESRRASRDLSGKKSLAEYCIVRRIHFIYERMLRKFRGDLDLWSRWLRFCRRTGSNRQMSKVLTKALQLHSACAPLWTYAAAWEFEHNLNAAGARALMQRGLRMCKQAPELWHEYFRMELLYALRLRERRRVLGIDSGEGGVLLGAGGGTEAAGNEGEGEETDASAAAVAAVLNGAVALVVYKGAIAAVPGSVPFRAKFLHMLQPLEFPGKAALEAAVYDSVAADFGGSPEAWDLLARRPVLALPPAASASACSSAVQAAVAVYEQGVQAAPCSELVAMLLAFLQQQMQAVEESSSSSGRGSGQHQEAAESAAAADWLRQRAQQAYQEAGAAGLLTEALRLDGIAFLLHVGDTDAAVAAARAAVQALPQSAPLWQQLLVLEAVLAAEQLALGSGGGGGSSLQQQQLEQQAGSSSGSSDDEADLPSRQHSSALAQRQLERVVLQALQAVPASEATPVWLTALNVMCGCGCSLQALCQQLMEAAIRQARGPAEGGLGAVAAALLSALHQSGGIQAARSLYRALLPLPPPGGDFYRCLLQLELQLAAAAAATGATPAGASQQGGQALTARQLSDLFEAAVSAYGSEDVQLWLLYAEWQAGGLGGKRAVDGDGLGAVYWKACKALRQPEEFVAAYQLKFKLRSC